MTVQSSPPGSPEELAAFAALQSRLPALFRKVFADPREPRTVVIVPGLSMDSEVLAKVVGGLHYEERQLAMLMLLRLPNTRLVFVSSMPIETAIIEYYLGLLPGVTRADALHRLVLLAASDASPQTLTRKILERPRLLERIRVAIGDPTLAHLTVFNATPLERTLAVRLGIPLYGCDPALLEIGSKSGSRQAFREAGIALPDGAENLRDTRDLAAALADLKRRHPRLASAVVKLNDGFSGGSGDAASFCVGAAGRRLGSLRDRDPCARAARRTRSRCCTPALFMLRCEKMPQSRHLEQKWAQRAHLNFTSDQPRQPTRESISLDPRLAAAFCLPARLHRLADLCASGRLTRRGTC